MKIIGVGNAIVDVICNVNDNFLKANDLTKGTMKLAFDKGEFEKMLSGLEIKKNSFWRICRKFDRWFITTQK